MLKLSGEAFCEKSNHGIHPASLRRTAEEIQSLAHFETAITVGGGNFWRYRDCKDLSLERSNSDFMGMVVTVLNALALVDALKKLHVSAVALSCIRMPQVIETYNRVKALSYLEKGFVVILAGGTGNPYFTTDSAAALHGLELHCDIILKATKVDFVYDKDPMRYSSAHAFKTLTFSEILEDRLEIMDLSAISLCQEHHLPIRVFHFFKKGNLLKAASGKDIGTFIS